MPITELLEENARKYGNDVALVEVNPQVQETRRVLWKDYDLIQPTSSFWYRREITWHVFDEKANRFAQLLMSRGVKKGDKVAILLMNCLEWLPIYFGTLKTGALAVPMNFRYSAEEIEYCLDLAEADVLVFGPEFIGRIETIAESISKKRILFYVGGDCPSFAEDYGFVLRCRNHWAVHGRCGVGIGWRGNCTGSGRKCQEKCCESRRGKCEIPLRRCRQHCGTAGSRGDCSRCDRG